MLACDIFFNLLTKSDVRFFTGVPDSLLKEICAYITDHTSSTNHIIASNEGNAVGLATGYYLSTNNIPLVYMQNSGLGNAINPLTSLADPEVYSIPLLLLVGWRGEPGVKDEPQHIKMGRIQNKLLESLEIPYEILSQDIKKAVVQLKKAIAYIKKHSAPYAIVVKKDTFAKYALKKKKKTDFGISREQALELILSYTRPRDIIVSTTGKTSRELFELREKRSQSHDKDFLTVGSMGHSSSIALSIALQKPRRTIWCIDGDGAVLMHMGSITIIGQQQPKNLRHIVINNFAHESVGGQPTASNTADIINIAKSSGYRHAYRVNSLKSLKKIIEKFRKYTGPSMLEILCDKGSRDDLGRPTRTPIENKKDFMKFLK